MQFSLELCSIFLRVFCGLTWCREIKQQQDRVRTVSGARNTQMIMAPTHSHSHSHTHTHTYTLTGAQQVSGTGLGGATRVCNKLINVRFA